MNRQIDDLVRDCVCMGCALSLLFPPGLGFNSELLQSGGQRSGLRLVQGESWLGHDASCAVKLDKDPIVVESTRTSLYAVPQKIYKNEAQFRLISISLVIIWTLCPIMGRS